MNMIVFILFCLFIECYHKDFPETNYVASSEKIYGCWNSATGGSNKSFIDSLYDINNFYVHFRICMDENNNIEIIKKVLEDCCNENSYNFSGKYRLNNDTIIITVTGRDTSIEKYSYKVLSDTMFLYPIIKAAAYNNITFESEITSKPLLKCKWIRN